MTVVFEPQARENPHYRTQDSASHEQFQVTIIDNDVNTYEEVISVCMEALGINFEEAYEIALAVDNNGAATVFQGDKHGSERVAGIIRKIGIEVRVEPV